MDRLRSSVMAVGQFDITYWSFSKSCIKQALSVLDPQMEEQAIKMFSSILVYSGLGEPGRKTTCVFQIYKVKYEILKTHVLYFSICMFYVNSILLFYMLYVCSSFVFILKLFILNLHFFNTFPLKERWVINATLYCLKHILFILSNVFAAKPFIISSIFDSGNQFVVFAVVRWTLY
jgi:hypothetical protein